MENKTIRQRVEQLFGLPAMKMPWSLYLAQLNEAGKLTARSIMDIMTVVLESLEQIEEDVKDTKLMAEAKVPETMGEMLDAIKPEVVIGEEPKVEAPKTTAEKVSEVTEKVVTKGLVDAILGDKPPEPKV